MQRYAWDVYRGQGPVDWPHHRSTADEALEAAEVEYTTDAWKLIAVRCYEIA